MTEHIKTNNIKSETKGPKCLPKKVDTIKVYGPKFQIIIKNGKTNLFVCGFLKILRYVSIFLKLNFKDAVQKIPIEGASNFRVTKNNFLL